MKLTITYASDTGEPKEAKFKDFAAAIEWLESTEGDELAKDERWPYSNCAHCGMTQRQNNSRPCYTCDPSGKTRYCRVCKAAHALAEHRAAGRV